MQIREQCICQIRSHKTRENYIGECPDSKASQIRVPYPKVVWDGEGSLGVNAGPASCMQLSRMRSRDSEAFNTRRPYTRVFNVACIY